jgi:hypothetical protein
MRTLKRVDMECLMRRATRDPATGCLEWNGALNSAGCGTCQDEGSQTLVHRIAYVLAFGEIPTGMCVLHRCDNRRCFEPSHLWVGTVGDNNRDCWAKGRRSASKSPLFTNRKLTEGVVTEMRRLIASGKRQCDIAAEFGVTATNLSRIILRKTWANI